MRPSYISRPIHIVDSPVPMEPRLKFVYNFFEADERVSEVPPKMKRPISALTTRELSQKIPRYVVVSWKKTRFDPNRSVENSIPMQTIESNASEIADETTILSDTTMLYFQDFDQSNRIGERFEASARMRGILSGSSTDVAAKLNDATLPETDGDIIQRYLSIATQQRALFISGDSRIEPIDASAADQLAMIIDNDYLVNSSREFSSSPVGSSMASVRANSKIISRRFEKRESKLPNLDELEPEMGSIDDIPVSSPGRVYQIEHVGYMIERFEINQGDTVRKKKTFYIPTPSVSTYIDSEIKYGVQYVYSVRNLITFSTTTVSNTNQLQRSRFLVTSRPSTFSSILTEEYVPPPSPADLNFRWEYQNASLQIDWAFPTNTQRDIKGWQVFRRSSVDEPFSLIAQLDFDDSVIKTPSSESVDKSLIKRYKSSTSFYIDPEYTKDSDFIYAVTSVDAHGMTSNYSAQFRVTFDRIQNKLKKVLISPSGAAKQYPNTYLKAELSLDSVKSTKASKLRVYFDPEYLNVKDNKGRDLKFLKTNDRSGLYRFMLLNTDRQLQSNFDITVEDKRSERRDRDRQQEQNSSIGSKLK